MRGSPARHPGVPSSTLGKSPFDFIGKERDERIALRALSLGRVLRLEKGRTAQDGRPDAVSWMDNLQACANQQVRRRKRLESTGRAHAAQRD